MSIAQKSIAIIASIAVATAILFSFVVTIKDAQAAGVCPHTWAANLKMGSSGADVMALQQFLNSDPATMVAATGVGSPGMESSYFGGLSKAAVIKFQNKYASDVLAPAGLTAGNGNFFAFSRAKANMLCSGSTPSPTPTPAPGTGLQVMPGVQPANSLAPQGASRVPFTRFTLTAGNDGDVVVNGVSVQRAGLGSDASFNGVILVDEATGQQLGNSQNFNSNHQATVGGTFTVPRGTTRSYLLAGNMVADESTHAGEAPALSVVGVNTTAVVSGSFPIMGAFQTINSTFIVGSVTIATSNSYASNSNQTVNIGDTGRKTTGLRLTAGSAEDLTLKVVRFYQTGSVSATDLANAAVFVNGTSYPLTVSADGKYYAASLGAGVVIAKGNQIDMYVSYDVVGGNANGRTVIFDVDKNTDILAYGNTYGYGVSPAASVTAVPATRGTETVTSGSPFVFATQDTITGASVTTISKANEVPAQNIAINVPNQPLGGFVVDLKGEAVTAQTIVFTIASTSPAGCTTGSCLLTNVTLVDQNGAVVAGPYDGVSTGANQQTITMASSITFPTGRHVYTLRGKVASSVGNGTVYTATTVPSGWTNVRGNTSGNTISITQGSFSMNPMTVKAGALVIGPASSLTSQNIVPGGQQVELGRMVFDAGQSGEDVRISSVPAALAGTLPAGLATDITSCQLYNGASSLTTGSNTVNPTQAASSTNTYILDNPVTVTKGTILTLSVKCNVSGNAVNNSTFIWTPGTVNANGSVNTFVGNFTVTGAVSGTTITATQGSGTAATFTVAAGTFTATAANSAIAQPSLMPAAAGATGVTLGYIKFRATNEPVNLTKVGLTLANGVYGTKSRGDGGSSASGTGDVVTVWIYNGATQVGSATFNGGQVATSTLGSAVLLAKDVDTILTIKADLAQIGVSGAGGIGDTLKVDPLNAEGTGASSGSVVAIGATSGVSGVQLVKSYPTVAFVSNATNPNGTNVVLKKFTVTANASGAVGVRKLAVALATSSASVTAVKLYAYSDSGYSQGVSSQSSGTGQLPTQSDCTTTCTSNTPTVTFTASTNMIEIQAGTTVYFALLGTVTPASNANNWTISPTLQGDSAAQTGLGTGVTNGYIATSTANVNTSNFTWSDNATTTAVAGDVDWFNGFQIPGLPGTGI